MREKVIARYQLNEIKRLVRKHRSDWPAVFSTNIHREIWVFVRWGYTPGEDRISVEGICTPLDEIASEFREVRNGGGRFFIDPRGVFYKDCLSQLVPAIRFRIYG